MQRVIKFRGKTIEGGIWVYGNLNVEFDGTTRICYWYSKLVDEENNCYEPTHCCETVDSETVGQYSGLKDKNGSEIYEGDIIELVNTVGNTIHVVCEYGIARRPNARGQIVDIPSFYFKNSDGGQTFPIVENYLGKHDLELFEIIGNAYQSQSILNP